MAKFEVNNLVDVHCHMLPGIDDGAQNEEEAFALIDMAHDDGTRTIIFTPHYREPYKKNKTEYLKEVFNNFKVKLNERYPDMQFYLGCEVHYDSEVPELLSKKEVMSYNGTHYALIEFRYRSTKSQILAAISEVVRYGYTPIIAHVERYAVVVEDEYLIDDILDLGALIQMNADSIMGKQGFKIKHFCHKMLKDEIVDFVASDAHDVKNRPPYLSECYTRVAKKYGEDYAERIFKTNALAVLAGKNIY